MNNKRNTELNKKMINNVHDKKILGKSTTNRCVVGEINHDKKESETIDQPNYTENKMHNKPLQQHSVNHQRKILPTVPPKPLKCKTSMVKAGGFPVISKDTLNNQNVNSKINQDQKLNVHQEDISTIVKIDVNDAPMVNDTNMSNVENVQSNLHDKNKIILPETTKKGVVNTNIPSKIPDKCILKKPIELTSEKEIPRSLKSSITQKSNTEIESEKRLILCPYPILDTDPTLDNSKLSVPLSSTHLLKHKVLANGKQYKHKIEESYRHNKVFQYHNKSKQLEKNTNNCKHKDLNTIEQLKYKASKIHNKPIRQTSVNYQRKILPTIPPKPLNSKTSTVKAGGFPVITKDTLNNQNVNSKINQVQKLNVHQEDISTTVKIDVNDAPMVNDTNMSNVENVQSNLHDKIKIILPETTKKGVVNTNIPSKIPDNSLNKCLFKKPIELTSEKDNPRSLKSSITQKSNTKEESEKLLKLCPYPILDTDPTLDNSKLSVPLSGPHSLEHKVLANGKQYKHKIEESNRQNEVFQYRNKSRQLEKNTNNCKHKDLNTIEQLKYKATKIHNKPIRQTSVNYQRKILPTIPPKPLYCKTSTVKAGGFPVITKDTLNNQNVNSKINQDQKLNVHQEDISTTVKIDVNDAPMVNDTNMSNVENVQSNLHDKNKIILPVTTKKGVVNTNIPSKIPDKCLFKKPIKLSSEKNILRSFKSLITKKSNTKVESKRLLRFYPYPILDTDLTLNNSKLSESLSSTHLLKHKVLDNGKQYKHKIEESNSKTIDQPNFTATKIPKKPIRQPLVFHQRKLLVTSSPKATHCKKLSLKSNVITKKSIKSSIASKKNLIPYPSFKEPIRFPYYKKLSVAPQKERKLEQHSAIRCSLFSNVSPYIRFSSFDVKGQPFPLCLQKILKWKLTSVTPAIVRRCIENTGFNLVRSEPIDYEPIVSTNFSGQKIISLQRFNGVTPPVVDLPWNSNSINNDLPQTLPHDWVGTWGKHMNSVNFKRLCEQHKLNHIPGTFQIGRKDRLWVNMQKCILKYGLKEFGFIPTSYVLPQDIKKLREVWEKDGKEIKWIIKPPAAARGSGIRVISKWSQIPKKVPLVVQSYIDTPYLINDTKFDLRIYVLITSINPLKLYLFDNGLVRFASVKYSSDFTTLSDRYMHLTNYSINRFNTQYTTNEDVNACHGHKWTLKSLWTYLEKERHVDVEKVWKSLMDLVVKTIICGESPINEMCQLYLGNRYNSYELFGIDVLFDEYLKPWILEVNISPSLHSTSELDKAVKGSLIKDLMNVVGYHIPNNMSPSTHCTLLNLLGVNPPLCYDKRMYTLNLSAKEQDKQEYYKIKSRQEYINNILDELLPDDVRHLITYEDELTQLGSFKKVFPTTSTFKYHQYFDGPRYYNMLLDAWEHKYSKKREEGIAVLEKLCRSKVHLEVPPDNDLE